MRHESIGKYLEARYNGGRCEGTCYHLPIPLTDTVIGWSLLYELSFPTGKTSLRSRQDVRDQTEWGSDAAGRT